MTIQCDHKVYRHDVSKKPLQNYCDDVGRFLLKYLSVFTWCTAGQIKKSYAMKYEFKIITF